ncbi:MAG: magnesium transporter, partial [Candidatus Babeliales bacterium]
LGQSLWRQFISLHPADIASFIVSLSDEKLKQFFQLLPNGVKLTVFEELPNTVKVFVLSFSKDKEVADALNVLSTDELTDLFDLFSDEELKKYLGVLHKKARDEVISLMRFHPESAAGIMEGQVITFHEDYTVEKSINLLQRLRPRRDIHQQIYVTDATHRLVGHVLLEDLVLQGPKARIGDFMHKNELVAQADEDQEIVAQQMRHYGLMTVPVVAKDNHFLGVISSETLVDIIAEEASEDVQKMAALYPLKHPYFQVSFFTMFYQRLYILILLLLAESFSGTILRSYEATLTTFLMSFLPMLVNAGGGASGQTSTVVIQGIASGEIGFFNMGRFFKREFVMALTLGVSLGVIAFVRIMLREGTARFAECIAIGAAVSTVVTISIILGAIIPFLLKKCNIDPAFSAGPFLATIMDMLGILIFCYITKYIVFYA